MHRMHSCNLLAYLITCLYLFIFCSWQGQLLLLLGFGHGVKRWVNIRTSLISCYLAGGQILVMALYWSFVFKGHSDGSDSSDTTTWF